jgi:glycosyltransferase involved in cell wall biosynthesis
MYKYALPPISIIIPIYNCEKYLKNCLNSVVRQTLQDYELILINDSSTDSTSVIIDSFIKQNKQLNIKYYTNTCNKGEGYSRNLGIKVSQGEFLCFCDADDEYDIQFLDELFNAIVDSKDLVYCGFDIIDTIKNIFIPYEKKWKYIINSNDIITSYLQLKLHFSHVGAIYRKSFLVEKNISYNESCQYGEDIEFVCNILLSAPRCGCVPKTLYHYKIRADSISTTLDAEKIISPFYVLNKIYKKMKFSNMKFIFFFGRYASVSYHTIEELCTYHIKLTIPFVVKLELLIPSVIYIFRKKIFFKQCTYKQLRYFIFL